MDNCLGGFPFSCSSFLRKKVIKMEIVLANIGYLIKVLEGYGWAFFILLFPLSLIFVPLWILFIYTYIFKCCFTLTKYKYRMVAIAVLCLSFLCPTYIFLYGYFVEGKKFWERGLIKWYDFVNATDYVLFVVLIVCEVIWLFILFGGVVFLPNPDKKKESD